MEEACFYVADNNGDLYNIACGGDISGSLSLSDIPFSFEITGFTGNILLTKSNLDYKEINVDISGKSVFTIWNIPVDISIYFGFDIPVGAYDFPLEEEKSWTIESTEGSFDIEIVLYDIIKKTYHSPITTEEIYAECVGMEVVSACEKTYNTYNISYGNTNLYYDPSIGNWVLFTTISNDFVMELKATSYPSPDNPQKPQTPNGETNGKTGKSYKYTTKTVDPNGDQIMYGWDWNKDMIPDTWTDLHNSDETITTEHTWDEDGNYEVRVKARDTNGLESEWSDPLPVNMPVNKLRNRLFQKSLIRLLLEKLIDKLLK